MIHVDSLTDWGPGVGWFCHCWSDLDDPSQARVEVENFCRAIGVKAHWSHRSQSGVLGREWFHYDLRPKARLRAVQAGAVETDLKAWLWETAVRLGKTGPWTRQELNLGPDEEHGSFAQEGTQSHPEP